VKNLSLLVLLVAIAFNACPLTLAVAPESNSTIKDTDTESSSSLDESWRHNHPLPQPQEILHLPKPETYKLSNGLTVQLVPDHRVPFITVALGLRTGSTYDPPNLHGLASMAAPMLLEGSAGKSSKQIASEIDSIGGALKCSADYDFTILSGSSLSKYTPKLLDLLSEVLLHPDFPDDELALKKANVIQELKLKRSDPNFLSEEEFAKVVFGNHPYSVVTPPPESIEKMTRQDVRDFYVHSFIPNDAVLIMVGDFDSKELKEKIESYFGPQIWKMQPFAALTVPSTPSIPHKCIYIVDRSNSIQSTIKVGNLSISKTDPDYFALEVANQILGGGAQSRLFMNIREDKGFTYGAYSHLVPHQQPGSIDAEASVRTNVTSPALQEFLYELEKIRNVLVSSSELANAKNFLNGSFELGLETQAGLAQRLLEVHLYNLPSNYLGTYTANVNKVSTDDVRRVARRWIDLSHLSIVVVGNAQKIRKDLEYYCPVEVFDTNGKRELGANVASTPSH
jgi:predicted Zn-dependent peptidase